MIIRRIDVALLFLQWKTGLIWSSPLRPSAGIGHGVLVTCNTHCCRRLIISGPLSTIEGICATARKLQHCRGTAQCEVPIIFSFFEGTMLLCVYTYIRGEQPGKKTTTPHFYVLLSMFLHVYSYHTIMHYGLISDRTCTYLCFYPRVRNDITGIIVYTTQLKGLGNFK